MPEVDDHDRPHVEAEDGHSEASAGPDAHGHHSGGGAAHGSDDGHGHDPSEPLGPVDSRGWLVAVAGSALAIIVVVALYLTISA